MSYKEKYYKYKSKYLNLKGGSLSEYNLCIVTNENINKEIYEKVQNLYELNNQMCKDPNGGDITRYLTLNTYFHMFGNNDTNGNLIRYDFDYFKESKSFTNGFKLYYIHKEDGLYAFGFLTHQEKYNIDYLEILCKNFDKNITVPRNMVNVLLNNIYNDSANGIYLSPASEKLITYYTKWKTPTIPYVDNYLFFIKNEINEAFKNKIKRLYKEEQQTIRHLQITNQPIPYSLKEQPIPDLLKQAAPIKIPK